MFFEGLVFQFILESLFRFFEWLFATLLTPLLDLFPGHVPKFGLKREKKRQAKGLLKRGLMLLREGYIDGADVRIGAALVLWPDIVDLFSKKEQERLMAELACGAGKLKATELWLQLAERGHSRQRTQQE